jgi:hypothetical protein
MCAMNQPKATSKHLQGQKRYTKLVKNRLAIFYFFVGSFVSWFLGIILYCEVNFPLLAIIHLFNSTGTLVRLSRMVTFSISKRFLLTPGMNYRRFARLLLQPAIHEGTENLVRLKYILHQMRWLF